MPVHDVQLLAHVHVSASMFVVACHLSLSCHRSKQLDDTSSLTQGWLSNGTLACRCGMVDKMGTECCDVGAL